MKPGAVDGVMWLRRAHTSARRLRKISLSPAETLNLHFHCAWTFWILVARRGIIVVNLTQFLTRARSVHKYVVCIYIYCEWAVCLTDLCFLFRRYEGPAANDCDLLLHGKPTSCIWYILYVHRDEYDTLLSWKITPASAITLPLNYVPIECENTLCLLHICFSHTRLQAKFVCAELADCDLSRRAPGESPNRCSQSMHIGVLRISHRQKSIIFYIIICGLDISPCVKFSHLIFATAVFL